ncbi:MAG: hypothetical protein OEM67_00200 [Thermoleophilia bacterium]|nr:hypothetical protein [Thermoleophilia bacterium]MDH3724471.1 hypothetical protein [Thermoleophilia bacterium]
MSSGRAGEVADDLWQRVRDLAARIDQLEKRASVEDLGPDEQARLDRMRIRVARAARRAELADDVADQLADPSGRRPL